jgi:hypothetical protein
VKHPKLLAVDFADQTARDGAAAAQVYVGTTLFSRDNPDDLLETDPALAERSSVTLPYVEPRAYPPQETVSVSYEGPLAERRLTGLVDAEESTLKDGSAFFCDAGVQGVNLMTEVGQDRFGLDGDALQAFAERHADYVQVTSELPNASDAYWRSEEGQSCGGFEACDGMFGATDLDEPNRELRVLNAFQDRLRVELRRGRRADTEAVLDKLSCCFPRGAGYVLRASEQWVVRGSVSGFKHRVVTERQVDDAGELSFACVLDCNPRKQFFEGRAFEVSPDSESVCRYGEPVSPAGAGAECVFSTLTSQFAVYRGQEPSQRDMAFSYDMIGGFRALGISLVGDTSVVLPETLTEIPGFSDLAVVDSQDRGLMVLSLSSLRVRRVFF